MNVYFGRAVCVTLWLMSIAAVSVTIEVTTATFKSNNLHMFLWAGLGLTWLSICLIAASTKFSDHWE